MARKMGRLQYFDTEKKWGADPTNAVFNASPAKARVLFRVARWFVFKPKIQNLGKF
jgi:hypothetical protein